VDATPWLRHQGEGKDRPAAYFGANTGAAAALVAARQEHAVRAVVSRGGRTDLADRHQMEVKAPLLLIVEGNDYSPVIRANGDGRVVDVITDREIAMATYTGQATPGFPGHQMARRK
jgi:dienelactone hydrolase